MFNVVSFAMPKSPLEYVYAQRRDQQCHTKSAKKGKATGRVKGRKPCTNITRATPRKKKVFHFKFLISTTCPLFRFIEGKQPQQLKKRKNRKKRGNLVINSIDVGTSLERFCHMSLNYVKTDLAKATMGAEVRVGTKEEKKNLFKLINCRMTIEVTLVTRTA